MPPISSCNSLAEYPPNQSQNGLPKRHMASSSTVMQDLSHTFPGKPDTGLYQASYAGRKHSRLFLGLAMSHSKPNISSAKSSFKIFRIRQRHLQTQCHAAVTHLPYISYLVKKTIYFYFKTNIFLTLTFSYEFLNFNQFYLFIWFFIY